MGHNEGLEVLLAQGSKGHAFQLAAQLEGGGEERFSSGFEAAMEGMIREQSRQSGGLPGWKRQLRAAGLALVCLVGLGFGAMRVEAIRNPLQELFIGESEAYTQVQFPSLEDNASFRGEVQDYLPTWVPQGYRLESISEDSRFIHAAYGNGKGERLLLTATPSSGASVMLDRQGTEVVQTEIGTRGAFLSRRVRDGRMVVLMYDDSYAYTLTSYLGQEDAISVMESIPGAGG